MGTPKCAYGDGVCGADSLVSCPLSPTPLCSPTGCLDVPTCPRVGMGRIRRTLEEAISPLECYHIPTIGQGIYDELGVTPLVANHF